MSLRTFNVGGIYNGVQPGMIASYIGTTDDASNTTTADPPGWVIANGKERTNGGDGRYNNLIELGIGEGTLTKNAASYTPINLKASMLRGIGSQTYNDGTLSIEYKGNTNLGGKNVQIMKEHTHGFTVAKHLHDLRVKYNNTEYSLDGGGGGGDAGSTGTSTAPRFGLLGIDSYRTNDGFDKDANELNLEGLVDVGVEDAVTPVKIKNMSGNAGTNIFPVNYGVHWIIKL
jgi:hypothetical protein